MLESHAEDYPAFPSEMVRPEPKVALPLDAEEPRYRSVWRVLGLSAATLFIGYPIYLCYQWARELNGLMQQARHSPPVVLLLSVGTLGIGAMIYECIFAYELARYFESRGRPDSMPHLAIWVIVLNVASYVLAFTAVLFPLAIPCGLAATCLIQTEFNKVAISRPS
jgi:hypothetical protein